MKDLLTVKETAKILGMSEQGVRVQLQRKKLPFGLAVPSVSGKGWRYIIPRAKLEEFLGKELTNK